jgi:rubrerythrin
MDKKELLEEIAKMIESDADAVPMQLNILEYMSEEELSSILKNLYKSKQNRSKENETWFDELCKK